jgi:hypothetical protein
MSNGKSVAAQEITRLTDTQGKIVSQLCHAVRGLGGDQGLLCILGSWGDTLPDSEILQMLVEYNSISEQPQHQSGQRRFAA